MGRTLPDKGGQESRGARPFPWGDGLKCRSVSMHLRRGGTKPCPTLTNGNLVGDDAHIVPR